MKNIKTIFKKTFLAFVVNVCFFSCSKNEEEVQPLVENPPQGIKTNIYVAGSESTPTMPHAVLWTNGVLKNLTDTTKPSGVFDVCAYGNDVYVVGVEAVSYQIGTAMLWKNNEKINLTTGLKSALAKSIAVNETGVYIVGEENNGSTKTFIKLWKNGAATDLTDGTQWAEVNKVQVVGNDVYVLGSILHPTTLRSMITVWKNGASMPVTNGVKNCTASDFKVVGNDIYITGYELTTGIYANKIWKNGVSTTLDAGSQFTSPLSLDINNNDVYVTGIFSNDTGTGTITKLWKNQQEIPFPLAPYTLINDITFFENKRYLLGSENEGAIQKVFYYSNDNKTFLNETKRYYASAIFINKN